MQLSICCSITYIFSCCQSWGKMTRYLTMYKKKPVSQIIVITITLQITTRIILRGEKTLKSDTWNNASSELPSSAMIVTSKTLNLFVVFFFPLFSPPADSYPPANFSPIVQKLPSGEGKGWSVSLSWFLAMDPCSILSIWTWADESRPTFP